MKGACLKLENSVGDAISKIRFAPQSNNLLISSWDSYLRLYDVDGSAIRLEAPSNAALLSCCFHGESVALSVGSDGSVRRYDLHSGSQDVIGNHADIATCVEHSDQSCQVITSGLDKMIMFWDLRMENSPAYRKMLHAEVESMSLFGCDLMFAVGATTYVYDLRNLDTPLQSKESKVNARIRSISSAFGFKEFAVGSVDGRVAVEISGTANSRDNGYAFRCHPKTKNGKEHLVPVNDIVFNPVLLGAFVTGDDEGYVISWDAQNRRRLFELPRFPNSVASLSYNNGGHILAVASSYTYQEANELEEPPQIFLYEIDDNYFRSTIPGSSSKNSPYF